MCPDGGDSVACSKNEKTRDTLRLNGRSADRFIERQSLACLIAVVMALKMAFILHFRMYEANFHRQTLPKRLKYLSLIFFSFGMI